MDFDLNSGMVRFLLKLEQHLLDSGCGGACLEYGREPLASDRDQVRRPRCGHTPGSLNPDIRASTTCRFSICSIIARQNYKVVCADLSGQSRKVLDGDHARIAKDFPGVHARSRIVAPGQGKTAILAADGAWATGYELLSEPLYRANRLIPPAEVEQIVGAPVMMTFPNDYSRVSQADPDGASVDADSRAWVGLCSELGEHMAGAEGSLRQPEAKRQIRRILQHLAGAIFASNAGSQ